MVLAIICLIIVAVLLISYTAGRLSFVEVVFLAWSTSTYYILGITINPLFIISSVFGVIEIIYIIGNRVKFSYLTWFVICLPFISSVFFWITFLLGLVEYEIVSQGEIFTNSLYFFLKFYLPFFLIGHRIYREASEWDLESTAQFFKKIVLASAIVGLLQLCLYGLFTSEILAEIIGLKIRYRYNLLGLKLIRINAFLGEPKELALLMGIGVALFWKRRSYRYLILCTVVGILTLSNTFLAISLLFVIHGLIVGLGIRYKIWLVPTLSVIIFFSLFFFSQKLILSIDRKTINQNMPVVSALIVNRMIDRYDDKNPFAGKMLFGFPLQADLEAPIQSFFEDNPILFTTGFGSGNTTMIPNKYFKGTWAYDKRDSGARRWHANMGWLYWVYQIGFFGTVLIYFFLSTRPADFGRFSLAFTFLLTIFIVTRVELFIVVVLGLAMKKYRSD